MVILAEHLADEKEQVTSTIKILHFGKDFPKFSSENVLSIF